MSSKRSTPVAGALVLVMLLLTVTGTVGAQPSAQQAQPIEDDWRDDDPWTEPDEGSDRCLNEDLGLDYHPTCIRSSQSVDIDLDIQPDVSGRMVADPGFDDSSIEQCKGIIEHAIGRQWSTNNIDHVVRLQTIMVYGACVRAHQDVSDDPWE